MNTVTVKINGVEYNLKGKEDGKYLLDVAGYVDGKFREISANNSKLGTSSVAVLAALNIADELFKCDLEIEDITKKKSSLEERNLALKERLRELKEDIEESSKARANEIESFKKIIYSMEEKVNEVEKLEDTIIQLKKRIVDEEKYKNQVYTLQQELKLSKEENLKLNKVIEDLQLNISKAMNEKDIVISENQKLKESIGDYSLKCKEIEDSEKQHKEANEELKKAIIAKETELKEFKKNSIVVDEEKINNLTSQLSFMEKEIKDAISEKKALVSRNRDIKFELQNYKYKVLDLEKKLIDAQFNLAVEKKDKNPLLK